MRGFSILEFVIVVAVILILAAVSIPTYLAVRAKADKASAVNSVRVIQTAEIDFSMAQGAYTTTLSELAIPQDLQQGRKSGYIFFVRGCGHNSGAFPGGCFVVQAFPQPQNKWLNFRNDSICADETGKLLMSAMGCH